LSGVFVKASPVDDRRVDRVAGVIEHDDAAALAANVLHGREEQALQDGAQVERRGDLAIHLNQKFEQSFGVVFCHLAALSPAPGMRKKRKLQKICGVAQPGYKYFSPLPELKKTRMPNRIQLDHAGCETDSGPVLRCGWNAQ